MYASYGTGHKKIAEYIETYFKNNGNYEIENIDILKFSTPFLGKFSQKTFEKINFSIPYLWDILYNAFNRKLYLLTPKNLMLPLFNNKTLKRKIIEFNPDLVISTHFFSSQMCAFLKQKLHHF